MKKKFNPTDWLEEPKTPIKGAQQETNSPSSPPFQGEEQKAGSPPEKRGQQKPGSPPFQGGVPATGGRGGSTATSPQDAVELYINEIEKKSIDISGDYTTWRNLAFSLADEFSESGRDYFHRISRFHPQYNHKECDAQYTNCLKANGSGITIGTFFHLAKAAGIQIHRDYSVARKPQTPGNTVETQNPVSTANNIHSAVQQPATSNEHQPAPSNEQPFNEDDPEPEETMPVLPDSIFENLPIFLQKVVRPAKSKEERDILLLGSLTSTSACFPKLYGIYDDKKLSTNLFLFITAKASAGKGRLSLCKLLVQPIHKQMRDQAKSLKLQHANDLAEFNLNKSDAREKPAKPPERMLFIPANNSTTGIFQLLSDNKGRGLIFETEGDTLTNALKSDHGNFSDGLRNAWQGETISYYRRTDREYVDIENPCLSCVLSGTPKQITSLIPSAENGLFSRFIFYYMNLRPGWKRVFYKSSSEGIDDYYLALGEEFHELYRTLNQNEPIKVVLSEEQEERFHEFFSRLHHKYLHLQTEDYVATVRRLGVIAFRFAMLFTAFRIMEDGDVNKERECEDQDFDSVLQIIAVLVRHSSKVFSSLPEEAALPKKTNQKERFLESLPKDFDRPTYIELATALKINPKTAERYISQFVKKGLIQRDSYGKYLNSPKRENAESAESAEFEEFEEDPDKSSADSADSSNSAAP